MTYFHPRDFDVAQPLIKDLGPIRKFKSYYGLSKSFKKLTRLLSDFTFHSLDEATQSVNWHTSPTFELTRSREILELERIS
jgi:peptidoglycan-N-acetylglucosamine deacetylase